MALAILTSRSNTFILESLLREGRYGKVRKFTRMEDMKTVAIKTQKHDPYNGKQILGELESLCKLRELDSNKCNIVQFEDSFLKREYLHFVFEHLEKSLHQFIGERQSNRLNLQEIRPIVCQLANALNHLSTVGIIHTDLKLDNVMLVNHSEVPYKVKLIDFGLAIDVSADDRWPTRSTKEPNLYSSPEIFLGLPFTKATDMWSLGIMTVLMFLGKPLFPSITEDGVLRDMVETLGQPPNHMLRKGPKTRQYFKRQRRLWRLKTPEESNETWGNNLRSLDDLMKIYPMKIKHNAEGKAGRRDTLKFVDMLKEMLHLDPEERITHTRLLCHHFITGHHLVPLHTTSTYFRRSSEYMQVCQCFLDDYRKVKCKFLGEPHPVQSGGLPGVNSGLNPGLINEPLYQSALKKRPRIKRRRTNDGT